MIKKFLLSLLLIMLLLSGCSNNKADSNSKSTLCNSKASSVNSNSSTKPTSSSPEVPSKDIIAPYTLETAKRNHDLVILSVNTNSHYWEVYNFNYMKNFINNVKQGKKGKIRVVQYSIYDDKLLLDKLTDLESDGRFINYTKYNPFALENSNYSVITTILYGTIEEIKENGFNRILLKGNIKDQADNTPLTIITYEDSQLK